jgi:hypothetical protein
MGTLTANDISAFSSEAWNRTALGQPAARHELIAALDAESTAQRACRYYAIADDNDYLCIARVVTATDPVRSIDSALYGRAARALSSLRMNSRHSAICAWPAGRGRNVLLPPSLAVAEQRAHIHRICAAIEAEAQNKTVVFPDVLADDGVLAAVLTERGYVAASAFPVAFLDVAWEDLDGYLETLRHRNKDWMRSARHEINRFRRSGAIIEPLSDDPIDHERVCELLNRHDERLNGRSPGYRASMLGRLLATLREDLVARVSREAQGGPITAACIGVKHGTEAIVPWIGREGHASRVSFDYFNLAYYDSAAAYAHLGIRRICFGNAAYEAKIRRGCRIVRSQIYVRAPDALRRGAYRAAFALQRRWYERKLGRYVIAGHA